MCNLFLKFLQAPEEGDYKLILASNRDENFRRPAEQAHFWQENTSVFGGQDMQPGCEGGTWLAMSKTGKIGVLLNVKGAAHDPSKLGRGPIVADLVKSDQDLVSHLTMLADTSEKYNKFQLVAVSLQPSDPPVSYFTNTPNSTKNNIRYFESGYLAVGNGSFDTPFQKTINGKHKFEEIVKQYGKIKSSKTLTEELLGLLKWEKSHYPDPEIDRLAPELSDEHRKMYGSIFLDIPSYGTRTHTIILVEGSGLTKFMEWTLVDDGNSKMKWLYTEQEFQTNL